MILYTLYTISIQFCTKFCTIFIYTHTYIFVYHIYLVDKLFPFLLFFYICWEKKRKLSEPDALRLEVIFHSSFLFQMVSWAVFCGACTPGPDHFSVIFREEPQSLPLSCQCPSWGGRPTNLIPTRGRGFFLREGCQLLTPQVWF